MGVSQIEVIQIRVPNQGPKPGSQIGFLNRGPNSQIGAPNGGVLNLGLKLGS
jgi:hypothetical protein